jgi:hypothetical protein
LSLAETQEIYTMLIEIKAVLDGVEVKTVKINSELPKTRESVVTFRELEYITFRLVSILNRMGLPPQIDAGITKLQQMLLVVRSLTMAMHALEMGTPFGYIKAAIGFVTVGFSLYDNLQGF